MDRRKCVTFPAVALSQMADGLTQMARLVEHLGLLDLPLESVTCRMIETEEGQDFVTLARIHGSETVALSLMLTSTVLPDNLELPTIVQAIHRLGFLLEVGQDAPPKPLSLAEGLAYMFKHEELGLIDGEPGVRLKPNGARDESPESGDTESVEGSPEYGERAKLDFG